MTTGLMPLLGLALATISFVGNILICALPQWRATELLYEVDPFESNVTVSQMFFQGIWKFCATTSSVLLTRCKRYEEIPLSISPVMWGRERTQMLTSAGRKELIEDQPFIQAGCQKKKKKSAIIRTQN